MNFLQKLLQGIAFVPTIVNSIEGLFGSHTGEQKKDSAISFVAAALQLTESVANREIVDEQKFKDGLSNYRRHSAVPERFQLGTRRCEVNGIRKDPRKE